RAVLTERVVALEGRRADIVDVNVLAGGDVAVGEADHLAVFLDRLTLFDRPQRELVSQADAAGDGDAFPLEFDFLARRQIAGGDGDVIFGTQVDGDLRQGHDRHGRLLRNYRAWGESHCSG